MSTPRTIKMSVDLSRDLRRILRDYPEDMNLPDAVGRSIPSVEVVRALIQELDGNTALRLAIAKRLAGDQEEPEEELERRRDKTKATYIAAVNELFRLLSLSAAEKSEDHKELVAAANNACGAARIIMLKAWEGEDETWQR